jgi:hypothetical protein
MARFFIHYSAGSSTNTSQSPQNKKEMPLHKLHKEATEATTTNPYMR